MINIIEQKKNVIYYECESCNTRGMCTIKPAKKDTTIVTEIVCPVCNETINITIIQYSSEDNKRELLNDQNDFDISWVLTKNEEIFGDN